MLNKAATAVKDVFWQAAGRWAGGDPYREFLNITAAVFDLAAQMKQAKTTQHLQVLIRGHNPGCATYVPVPDQVTASEKIAALPQTQPLELWVRLSRCQNDGPAFAVAVLPVGLEVATRDQWLKRESTFLLSRDSTRLMAQLRQALLQHHALSYEDAAKLRSIAPAAPRPL